MKRITMDYQEYRDGLFMAQQVGYGIAVQLRPAVEKLLKTSAATDADAYHKAKMEVCHVLNMMGKYQESEEKSEI